MAPNSKSRVKQLAVDLSENPDVRMARLIGNNPSVASSSKKSIASTSGGSTGFNPDYIGVDPSVSGFSFGKKKTGGVYGHFFHDLTPAVKELVMGIYKSIISPPNIYQIIITIRQ